MTRTPLLALAVLLLAGCGHSPSRDPFQSSPPAATKSANAASAKPHAAKTCKPTRDLIVWTKTPGAQARAQLLGDYDLATCETTLDLLRTTSPTGTGYCTVVAWADQNPGYNADATAPRRPKHVVETIGDC